VTTVNDFWITGTVCDSGAVQIKDV